ncbi:MAG: metal-chelation protein CHAD [Methylobacter sp.]|nr:MAG: metal-chelation protein CHAD [Methylobacter sp.]PPD17880.1 MAG: metal-chelation protein CHAD [Methylobacter sp.]PPD36368.1 MAG: metal-chelation protein CHAD [Methylomonas sp.]
MPLFYELPPNLPAEKFIAKLGQKLDLDVLSRQYSLKTYYDSFDWRLFRKGLVFEYARAKHESHWLLKALASGQLLASSACQDAPGLIRDFPPGKLRGQLESVLEMRALLAVCTIDYEAYSIALLNKDEKTVLRLKLEAYDLFNTRLSLLPIKGYDKALENFCRLAEESFALTPGFRPVMLDIIEQQGRKPKDYSSKLTVQLAPDMRADVACKYLYSSLLNTIKVNEQGVIADLDSEFLHDFRVAVRRTRAGLSQLKGVLPEEVSARFGEFFAWLGQISGPTRDLDMYLVNFENHKRSLPVAIRSDLEPLYAFIAAKKQKTHDELVKKLKSPQYLSTLSAWENFLKAPADKIASEPNARLTIKELADHRIWKVYNAVLKEADHIHSGSSAAALHRLRKTCKKLRYLMEFFQSLYPEQPVRELLKSLKEFQDILGSFQDCEVQEQTLKLFSEEMMAAHIQANTFLAMGVLIQVVDSRKSKARQAFAEKFAEFKQPKYRKLFEALFAKSLEQL